MIAQVEPLTTARALRGPFDYMIPPELADTVAVGSLLAVPFSGRPLLGVVVGLAGTTEVPNGRLLAVSRVIEPGIPPELVELAGWLADAYCSTRARALSLMLPPGAAAGTRAKVRLVAALTDAGAAALAGDGVRLTPTQRALLERLRDDGPLPAAGDAAALRRLEGRDLVALAPRVLGRRPTHAAIGARRSAAIELETAQKDALTELVGAICARRHERFLLHGVTGSGKTEVYLRAAAAALEHGLGVIVLVPEIGLTPQTVGRFIDRFGETVAVLHSRLRAGERHDEWLRLRRGEARICVGPRSAVFAPIDRLGLIVVDEEHDSSYKHEGDPRYDARYVAECRAETHGAVLVAGSATPRPESYRRLRHLRLPVRVDGGRLPDVELLDMRGRRGALHPTTFDALADLRHDGGKAIILLNRRGWSNFLFCASCGRVWGCPECDVSLVLHRAEGLIACHHCGHREPVPARCPDCASTSVGRHGLGTERLEHELAAALGHDAHPIFRLDGDVAAAQGGAAGVLGQFEQAASGVLLGTQMVAKGHDFDGVGLGVVLDADATLRFPDFRSEERTFALVAQLAGRAGRGPGGGGGRVLVQTIAPSASSLLFAAAHDSDGFLAAELWRRERLRYPPFGELIRIVCSAEAPGAALGAAREVRGELVIPGATVLGPAPLFRLRGRERAQIVIKGGERRPMVRAVGAAVAATVRRDVAISVDVDPQ
jgi:primosomal protein N' (replication factor Y)